VTAIQRSAIDELHPALARAGERVGNAVAIRELPFATQVSLRMAPESAGVVERALDVAVPLEPGTFTGADPAVLRLGPDEWLVVAGASVEADLRAALTGSRDAVVDVSDQRTTFELAGPRARDVLAAGCSIDLHPRVFGPGRCAETMLARAGVILMQLDDVPTFRVLARRSYARYVATWLLDAMIELGDGRSAP
jgi:sarcosine oxidase subunit gamma